MRRCMKLKFFSLLIGGLVLGSFLAPQTLQAGGKLRALYELKDYYGKEHRFWDAYLTLRCEKETDTKGCKAAKSMTGIYSDFLKDVNKAISKQNPKKANRS